ncbi:MAG TPA: FUSC family protein [Xanthobacteraceae bacterium]|nr:FUSC family protein [Xanthobacteraceae bacterium]
MATRLALICALTVLVAEIYQTPEPALAAYIVFFLNRESRMASLVTNVALLVVATVVIAVVFIVAIAVVDDPMWRFIGIALLSFVFLFLASASKLRPIGATLALVVGYALDQLGLIKTGEEGTRGLLYAWLFVGIPAGASIVVNLLAAPAPRRLAEAAIARRVRLCAVMIQGPDEQTRHQFRECLREGVVEIQKQLGLAQREKTSLSRDIEALRQAADSTVILLSAVDVLDRNSEAFLPLALRHYVAGTLQTMAGILTEGAYPVEIAWKAPVPDPPLSPLAADILASISHAIVRFAELPSPEEHVAVEAKGSRGFFEKDAFTNPDHVHYALKTTAAAMFCYMLYSLLDWPGIHTCFLTCYAVSLATTAETTEKLTLRISGCLIGAAVGISAMVVVIPSLSSIGALMIVIFFGTLGAAYVAGGGPRISYAGFQIAFAFFLCVVQGPAPAFDLETARDRIIGILIGNIVVYLLFTNLWPVTVGRRVDPAIAALLRRFVALMTANSSARRALASHAQLQLAEIETDIDLAGYEPGRIRPDEAWLATHRKAADEIGALGSLLLLSAEKQTTISAQIAKRLEALAARFAEAAPPPSAREASEWNSSPLYSMIDRGLLRLEEGPECGAEGDGGGWAGLLR